MSQIISISDLHVKFENNDFITKTIAQINKDLTGLTNEVIDIKDLPNNVLNSLNTITTNILKELDKNSQLQQFIYIVDLPEQDWQYFMSVQNFNELSNQIIVREAQKVYLRQIFSS